MAKQKFCSCFVLDDAIQLVALLVALIVLLIIALVLPRSVSIAVSQPMPYRLADALSTTNASFGNACRYSNLNLACVRGTTSIALILCGGLGCQNGLVANSNLNFQYLRFLGGFSIQECKNLGTNPTVNPPRTLFSMSMWDDAGLDLTPANTRLLFGWTDSSNATKQYGNVPPVIPFANRQSNPSRPYPSDPFNTGMLSITEELVNYSQLPSINIDATYPHNLESIVAKISIAEASFLNGLAGNPGPAYNFDISNSLTTCGTGLQMVCTLSRNRMGFFPAHEFLFLYARCTFHFYCCPHCSWLHEEQRPS
jgi:hypothetical protein